METNKNIIRAIAGESIARNKYTFFASKAREEGFEQIAAIFTETSNPNPLRIYTRVKPNHPWRTFSLAKPLAY